MSLETLLQRADVWRGGGLPPAEGIATGFPALDALLPGGGWPRGALTEILVPRVGVDGLSPVVPALARLSRGDRWIACVAPPRIPDAPALAQAGVDLSRILLIHPRAAGDGLWAVEQALCSGTCSAVLAWPSAIGSGTRRRLQRAAETGRCWGLLFRDPPRAAAGLAGPGRL